MDDYKAPSYAENRERDRETEENISRDKREGNPPATLRNISHHFSIV